MIGLHHEWQTAATRPAELARVIFLGDTLACHLSDCFNLTAVDQTTDPEMISSMGLTQEDLMEIWQNLPAHVRELADILHV